MEVPDVTAQPEADARSQLEAFKVEVNTEEVGDQSQVDVVLAQSPSGKTVAPRGATIELTIGKLAATTAITTTTAPTTTIAPTIGP